MIVCSQETGILPTLEQDHTTPLSFSDGRNNAAVPLTEIIEQPPQNGDSTDGQDNEGEQVPTLKSKGNVPLNNELTE